MPISADSGRSRLQLLEGASHGFQHDAPLYVETKQTGRVDGRIRPTTAVQASDGPWEFLLPAQSDCYCVVSALSVQGRARIVLSTNEPIVDGIDMVAPVTGFGSALFESVQAGLGSVVIGNGQNDTCAHYKANLDTLLSYSTSASKSHLSSQLFYKDTPGRQNVMQLGNVANMPFRVLHRRSQRSVPFDFCAPLTNDFLKTPMHIPPSAGSLSIKCTKARDELLINSRTVGRRYRIYMEDLTLSYVKTRLSPREPLPSVERYPVNTTEIKKFPLAAGLLNTELVLQQHGKLPSKIILACVSTRAFEGAYNENPFNYQHFNINFLQLRVNGAAVPSDGFRPDFTSDPPLVMREYQQLFANTGALRVDRGNLITYDNFLSGCTIFAFDFTPDLCNGAHLHLFDSGQVTAEIGWAVPLPMPITVLAYCISDGVFTRKRDENHVELEIL